MVGDLMSVQSVGQRGGFTSTFLSPQLSSNSSKSCKTKILDDYGMVRDGFTVFL